MYRYKLEEDRRAERHRRHSIIAGGKKVVINCLSKKLTDWLLVEVALLLIGLTKIWF
jgi:hypothetical protein